jgi:hypothetical protein
MILLCVMMDLRVGFTVPYICRVSHFEDDDLVTSKYKRLHVSVPKPRSSSILTLVLLE